jgi:hypothetical protein
MISLTCTNCRTVLTIDDAFAGGVCRCQHCGTIQTVPTHLKGGAQRAATAAAVSAAGAITGAKQQKAIYTRDRAAESGVRISTGLDELAEVVASSGGIGSGGSGLRAGRLRQTSQPSPTRAVQPPLKFWLSIASGVIAVLLVIVVWLSLGKSAQRDDEASDNAGSPVATIPTQVTPAPAGPHFCGIALDAPVVIYVLDRGSATSEVFDALKEASYKSIESLGADRKFQVIFWNNGQDDSYPAGLPAYARADNVTACRRATEDITAFGQGEPTAALRRAFANKASVIILATGKGLELDPGLVQQTLQIRKDSPTRIHTIAIGDVESPVLKEIAAKTGGEYKTITPSTLRAFGE